MRIELRLMPSGYIHRWGPMWKTERQRLRTSSCGRTVNEIRLTGDFPPGGRRCPRCEKVVL